MTVRRFTAQCLPRFGTKEIAQATATLRNFKPVDVADGSDSALGRERFGQATCVSEGITRFGMIYFSPVFA
jgi:hypothetical protein